MEKQIIFATIRQTAKFSGLAETYLRQLYHAGKLPHIRCGVKVMIDYPMLMAQLRQEAEQSNGRLD